MIHTRVKAEGLREKLATILSQEYKELAIQDLKVIGTGVQNIVFVFGRLILQFVIVLNPSIRFTIRS
ncbi:hypothetical protein ACT4UL_22130, partial [Bacillus sp. HC-TM]